MEKIKPYHHRIFTFAFFLTLFLVVPYIFSGIVYNYHQYFTNFDDYINITFVEYVDVCVGDTEQTLLYARDVTQPYVVNIDRELFLSEDGTWRELNIRSDVPKTIYQVNDGKTFPITITWDKPIAKAGTYSLATTATATVYKDIVKKDSDVPGDLVFKAIDCVDSLDKD